MILILQPIIYVEITSIDPLIFEDVGLSRKCQTFVYGQRNATKDQLNILFLQKRSLDHTYRLNQLKSRAKLHQFQLNTKKFKKMHTNII